MNETTMVWLFQGDGADAVSGCFATQEAAEQWIAGHKLSGVLTAYPPHCHYCEGKMAA